MSRKLLPKTKTKDEEGKHFRREDVCHCVDISYRLIWSQMAVIRVDFLRNCYLGFHVCVFEILLSPQRKVSQNFSAIKKSLDGVMYYLLASFESMSSHSLRKCPS